MSIAIRQQTGRAQLTLTYRWPQTYRPSHSPTITLTKRILIPQIIIFWGKRRLRCGTAVGIFSRTKNDLLAFFLIAPHKPRRGKKEETLRCNGKQTLGPEVSLGATAEGNSGHVEISCRAATEARKRSPIWSKLDAKIA